MSDQYPLLRSLDPYHQRLGYVNGVLLSAVRGLDSREGLAARFYDLMFDRVYESDPRWAYFMEQIDADALNELQKALAAKPSKEIDARDILMRGAASEQWLFSHDLWRISRQVYSSKGGLTDEPDKLLRPIELAKWLGLILPTYDLSEEGFIIRFFLEQEQSGAELTFNPLVVRGRMPLQLMYLRSILSAECLLPHLAYRLVHAERVATRGENGLLRCTIEDLVSLIGEPERPDEILETQRVMQFRESVLKSGSTEENYLRPRMEIMVDLGLLDRAGQGRGKNFPWQNSRALSVAAADWDRMRLRQESVASYLDTRFFSSASAIYDLNLEAAQPDEMLSAFASTFRTVGREFGFTPARTVATIACLLSVQSGKLMEVSDVMECVRAAAGGPMGQHLHFSGGSTFGDDFLIRVDPAFVLRTVAPR